MIQEQDKDDSMVLWPTLDYENIKPNL